jgi:hypothetical protein
MWNVTSSARKRTAIFVGLVVAVMVSSMLVPVSGAARSTGGTPSFSFSPTGLPPTPGTGAAGNASPHPGTIIYQDVAPGGATSEDPSVAYDAVSVEPILNVYQTLVAYNGSNTSSFLPELSLCVPGDGGADSCQATYGTPLIVDNTTTGVPQYWTFPIDKAARFYDPSTNASWSVYPSDVMFTFSRTCSFANLPGVGSQPGWIQCQALLPNGNLVWDSGFHAPYNNTPQHVLSSMLINDSAYCPENVMAASNGCVTFNADGGGSAWPFFLDLISTITGAGVEPCGWFTSVAAGVPGFSGTNATNGDGPCLLPGNATSTSQTTFQSWLASIPPTYWDNPLQVAALNTPSIQPYVRWHMVGSGPYYLANQPFQQSVGYTLLQNPDYVAPTGCSGQPNCEPLPGPKNYMAKITVEYEQNDTPGLQGLANGTTDFATIGPGSGPRMLYLIEHGRVDASSIPSLVISMLGFDLDFNVATSQPFDPQNITVPGDFFSYVGLREFLVNAFPYNTVENTIFTTDGIQYGFNYGGAIPQYMGNYYPTNISWPSGDPVTNASVNGSAAWWWAQATNPASPYYDSELTSCTTSSPCQFPVVDWAGTTELSQLIGDYLPYVSSLTGGRLNATTYDCGMGCNPFEPCLGFECTWPFPVFNVGWAPDYPDPTDYMHPLYYPNATYTSSDNVEQALSSFTCRNDNGGPSNPASMAGLVFWARLSGVPQACQGNAYSAMEWGMNQAANLANGPQRVLLYNLVEHIANGLALYIYYDQADQVATYAPWIASISVNANPTIGGAGDYLWYNVRYSSSIPHPVAFTESGLPAGTNWTVTLNETPRWSTGSIIAFEEVNGTYPFVVGSVAGYTANPESGYIVVHGSANATVTFAQNVGPSPAGNPSPWSLDAYVAYGTIAAGAAAAVVLTLRMRRGPRNR